MPSERVMPRSSSNAPTAETPTKMVRMVRMLRQICVRSDGSTIVMWSGSLALPRPPTTNKNHDNLETGGYSLFTTARLAPSVSACAEPATPAPAAELAPLPPALPVIIEAGEAACGPKPSCACIPRDTVCNSAALSRRSVLTCGSSSRRAKE
eukprot:scaffold2910_cov390-Prasinococcus_capsulatus_cf.AAC.32